MVGSRKVLIALAAMVVLAAEAVAEERCSFEFEEAGSAPPSAAMISPSGRQVQVYRGPVPMTAQVPSSPAQGGHLAFPPYPSDDDAGTVPAMKTPVKLKAMPVDSGTPFADEPSSASGCEQCDRGGHSDHCNMSTSCDHCGRSACCCQCMPFWAHRDGLYAESLYFRPRGVDMVHAIQLNGDDQPVGSVGVANPVFSGGFRLGFNKALDECSSIAVNYTNFRSHVANTLEAPEGGSVASLVLNPFSSVANSTSSLVTAGYDIDFQLADVDYRRLISYGPCHDLNYTIGVRYGTLRQNFQQSGDFTQPGDVIQTNTSVNFEGIGLKTGLDGERRIGGTQLSVYGKSFISVLFGKFNSNFTQFDSTNTSVQANSSWVDERAVPILEFEVGIRWTSRNGRWRSSTGYYTGYWFNTIDTPQFVQAAQTSNFVHLGETVTFDGFVSRLEFCY